MAEEFAFALGMVLTLFFAFQAIISCLSKDKHPGELHQPLRMTAAPSSWNAESRMHRAARRKVTSMVANALKLHQLEDVSLSRNAKLSNARKKELSGTRDQTSRNYILYGEKFVDMGGILWTFWRLIDGSLFREEGLWLNTRLVVIQISQLITGLFLSVFFFLIAERLAQEADDYRNSLAEDDYPDSIMNIFPTGEMVRKSFFPAAVVAIVIMSMIALLYIPRYVSLFFE